MSYSSSSNKWTWQDGKSRITEVYDNANSGRLYSTTDADGNTLTYTYTGNQLTKVTTAGGDYTLFAYNGAGLLTSIATTYTDGQGTHNLKRAYYDYDTSNRLSKVTIDLSPEGSAVSDGNIFCTLYGYDGTSNRISSITESDGTSLQIGYTLVGSTYEVSSLTLAQSSSASTTTTFAYGTGYTTVTDAQGNATSLYYDGSGRLTQLVAPPAAPGGAPQQTSFSYDGNGNLLYSGATGDPNFTNIGVNWNDLNTTDATVTTTQSTEVDGGVPVYRRVTNGTPASGWTMRLGQTAASGRTTVTAGQSVKFSVYVASSGASTLKLYAMWRDASGNSITNSTVATLTGGGTLGSSGVATALFASGTVTAPAGAVYVELMVQGTADGTGPLNVAIAQPTTVVMGGTLPPSFTYTYDGNGNMLSKTDSLGNQTVYVYDGNNQLLTKTVYADGTTPLTTRNVYDAESHLIFQLSPLGEVTQYGYSAQGQQTSLTRFTSNLYSLTGLATTDSPSASSMTSWLATVSDRSTTERTDTAYDSHNGSIKSVTTYKTIDSGGNATIPTTIGYAYDHAGKLVSRALADGTEAYIYDGLWRIKSFKDAYGNTTLTANANVSTGAKVTVTLANGTTKVSSYGLAGNLISSVTTGTDSTTATTTYAYDSNGNLIRVTDPTGRNSYIVYDDQNRKVADIAADGAVTAYVYNTADQLVSTISYATKLSPSQLSALSGEASYTAAPLGLSDVTPATSSDDRWSWNVYDGDGRLVEAIDAAGFATAYAYDGTSNLIATTAYATALSSATVTGFKTTVPTTAVLPTADATNDRPTRNFYDNDGRFIGSLDADGYLTEIRYDDAGQKIQTVAYATMIATVHRPTSTWSQLKNYAGTSASDIHAWYMYDAAGRLTAEIDGEGNLTQYANYSDMGFAQTVTRGQVVDISGLPTTATPLTSLPTATGTAEITSYDYDEYGHLLSQTLTLTGGTTETTTYTYDSVYNLLSQSTASSSSASNTADGRTIASHYDGLGRRIAAVGGNGASAQTSYVYDPAGRLKSQTDADGNRTLFYYDADGRLAYQVDATGAVVQYSYNAFDEQIGVTAYDARLSSQTLATLTGGEIVSALPSTRTSADSFTQTTYDVDGNVSTMSDALSAVTSYTYNAFGQLKSQVDPLLIQAIRTYSRRGQLLTSTTDYGGSNPLNLKNIYAYDAFGRVTTATDASGTQRSMTYDRAGRTATEVDGLGKTASFTYDGLNHVLTKTDRTGAVTSYGYSLFDRQLTVTDANGFTTTTTHNAYGQTVKVVDGTGATTAYTYDADGNLVSTTDALGNVTTQAFDNADRLTSVTSPRGIVTSYTYDGAGRTLTRIVDSGTGKLNLKTTWTYNSQGQILTVVDPNNVKTAYTYDIDEQRLTEAVDPTGLNLITTWTYDADGRNVTQTSAAGQVTQYTYDDAGRLTKVIADYGNSSHLNLTTQFAYDADGNKISETDALGQVTRYVYDAENRLNFAIDPAGQVTGYTYDNEGRLLQKVDYAALYTQSGTPALSDLQSNWVPANANATNDAVTRSTYDAGGRLVYVIDAVGAVTFQDYDADGRIITTTRYGILNTSAGNQSVSNM